ncbi:hypothetical protein CEXT_452601 [Caerostris extrusa]|uniref:Secreted protein n=1 Tax=Caerostris extrusa TaxID=172846 RepID=A0AAV4PG04_CAEEX|nr:hypothetical protein CEXT_452601 [Caerostris extrusa]
MFNSIQLRYVLLRWLTILQIACIANTYGCNVNTKTHKKTLRSFYTNKQLKVLLRTKPFQFRVSCFDMFYHEKVKFSRRLGVDSPPPLSSQGLIFLLSPWMSPTATPTPSHSSNQRREPLLPPSADVLLGKEG